MDNQMDNKMETGAVSGLPRAFRNLEQVTKTKKTQHMYYLCKS